MYLELLRFLCFRDKICWISRNKLHQHYINYIDNISDNVSTAIGLKIYFIKQYILFTIVFVKQKKLISKRVLKIPTRYVIKVITPQKKVQKKLFSFTTAKHFLQSFLYFFANYYINENLTVCILTCISGLMCYCT